VLISLDGALVESTILLSHVTVSNNDITLPPNKIICCVLLKLDLGFIAHIPGWSESSYFEHLILFNICLFSLILSKLTVLSIAP